jgi:hypothetical protein
VDLILLAYGRIRYQARVSRVIWIQSGQRAGNLATNLETVTSIRSNILDEIHCYLPVLQNIELVSYILTYLVLLYELYGPK